MKEILDVIVFSGLAFILFIYLRGMNQTQVEKHKKKIEEFEEKQKDDKVNETKEKEQ